MKRQRMPACVSRGAPRCTSPPDADTEIWPPRSPATAGGQLAVATAFHLFAVARSRLEIAGTRRFAPAPATIIVFKHGSDLDLPVLVHALFGPRVLGRGAGRIAFVARGDLYERGFLALYLRQLGPPRRLLHGFNVGGVLRRLNVLPANVSGPLLVADWLDQLSQRFGSDASLFDLLSEGGQTIAERFGVGRGVSVGAARRWCYHAWLEQPSDHWLLADAAARAVRVAAARRAQAQLQAVAQQLERGEMLVLAPEGGLSPDGTLLPFRGVLHRLLRRVPAASIVPVGLSYDLPGARPRAIVRVGERLAGLGTLSRVEAEARIRESLIAETTITLAHLAGEAMQSELNAGGSGAPVSAFAERLFLRAAELAGSGFAVDAQLLQRGSFEKALRNFVKRARGVGLSERRGVVRIDAAQFAATVNARASNPLGFARNELASLVCETTAALSTTGQL